jgi:hypothetical protein
MPPWPPSLCWASAGAPAIAMTHTSDDVASASCLHLRDDRKCFSPLKSDIYLSLMNMFATDPPQYPREDQIVMAR